MKTCGHTMGTPNMDIFEAIRFVAELGHQGIEIRCAANGQLNPEAYDSGWGKDVLAAAQEAGIEVACLTPYYKDFVRETVREHEIAGMRRVVGIAAELKCTRVRAYGGIGTPKGFSDSEAWARIAAALQEIGDYAAERNVHICIETHIGSRTHSAKEAARMVRDIDRPNVGVLFDYAWVEHADGTRPRAAVDMLSPYIKHVHVKDWHFTSREADERTTTLLGEGDLDWPAVIAELKRAGYDGFLSDEYEKLWHDYLPAPEIGMRHNAEYLRGLLDLRA